MACSRSLLSVWSELGNGLAVRERGELRNGPDAGRLQACDLLPGDVGDRGKVTPANNSTFDRRVSLSLSIRQPAVCRENLTKACSARGCAGWWLALEMLARSQLGAEELWLDRRAEASYAR